MINTILIYLIGLFMFAGTASLIYNMVTKQVTPIRKPIYRLALWMSASLDALFINYLIEQVWSRRFIREGLTALGTLVSFLLWGLLLILIPYVDRLEQKQLLQLVKPDDS